MKSIVAIVLTSIALSAHADPAPTSTNQPAAETTAGQTAANKDRAAAERGSSTDVYGNGTRPETGKGKNVSGRSNNYKDQNGRTATTNGGSKGNSNAEGSTKPSGQ